MTLRVKIERATILKKIVTVLNNLFHKISISISESSMNILMVTACNGMLFDICLVLDEVESDNSIEEGFTFSVNAKHFLESFNTLKTNDSVVISIKEDQMIIETISKEKVERAFLFVNKAQNLSTESAEEYDHEIEASHLNFPKLCKALNNTSRELIIRGNSRKISLKANLEGMYAREVEIGNEACSDIEFEDIYLTEHFLDISKIANLGNKFFFKAKKDRPLCVEARVEDVCSFKVFIKPKNFEIESS